MQAQNTQLADSIDSLYAAAEASEDDDFIEQTLPNTAVQKDGNGITVPIEDIAAGECDNCRLIPWDESKIFVEGCPDARNIWSYIYDIRHQNAIQLPSTEGLLSIDVDSHLFNMSLYRYHPEGGRYSVKRSYTIDGKFTGKEQVLEEKAE